MNIIWLSGHVNFGGDCEFAGRKWNEVGATALSLRMPETT